MIVPMCALGLVLSLLMLQLSPCRNKLADQLQRIDWIGFFLFTGSLIGHSSAYHTGMSDEILMSALQLELTFTRPGSYIRGTTTTR
jgi:hypothetical protein